jgi:hypothetical protein
MKKTFVVTVDTDGDDVNGCAVVMGIITILVGLAVACFAAFVFLSAVGGL